MFSPQNHIFAISAYFPIAVTIQIRPISQKSAFCGLFYPFSVEFITTAHYLRSTRKLPFQRSRINSRFSRSPHPTAKPASFFADLITVYICTLLYTKVCLCIHDITLAYKCGFVYTPAYTPFPFIIGTLRYE